MKRWNRRDLLKIGLGSVAIGTSPFETVLELMAKKATSGTAFAASPTNKQYICFQNSSAPPRWMFDLLLNPYDQAGFVQNPHMGASYTASGGRYTSVNYNLISYNGYKLPPLWRFDLPAPGGGTRKLTDIFNNFMLIRGIDVNNADHRSAMNLHFKPISALKSTTSLSSETSDCPVPAVNVFALEYEFLSQIPMTPVNLVGGNGALVLLEPFLKPSEVTANAEFANSLTTMSTQLAAAQSAIDESRSGANPDFASLFRSRSDLWKMVKGTFPDPTTEWTRLRNKYLALVNASIRATYPGINDLVVGIDLAARGSAANIKSHSLATYYVGVDDLRTLIQSTTTITNMAEVFASTEYIIANRLSSSVTGGPGVLKNLAFSSTNVHAHDEHFTGSMLSLLLCTLHFAAFGSCLLELVDVLKTKGMFDSTIIDIYGEFNRSPRADLGGSDHGFRGGSVALVSGAIHQPHIIGNIFADPSTKFSNYQYPGSWGYGAPIAELGGQLLGPAHVAASLAAFYGVGSPVTAAPSLIRIVDNEILPIPTLRPGKLIF